MSEVSDADDLHFISGQHSPSRRRTTIKYKINDDLPDLVKNRLYQEWAHQDGTVTVTTYACWADIISLHMVEAKEIDRDKRMYIPYFTKE